MLEDLNLAALDAAARRLVERLLNVLGGPLYVSYHTTPRKDRLAAVETLQLGAQPQFQLNEHAWVYLEQWSVLAWVRQALVRLGAEQVWSWEQWRHVLDAHLPGLGARLRARLWDAVAVGVYVVV